MKANFDRRARCLAGTDVWHFRADCTQWPSTVYASESVIPEHDAICGECMQLSVGEAA